MTEVCGHQDTVLAQLNDDVFDLTEVRRITSSFPSGPRFQRTLKNSWLTLGLAVKQR
jgi:hypothetical protein